MPLNDEYQPTIFPIPDEYTAESVMYGSAYRFWKSAKYYWDQVEDQLRHDIEDLKRQIRDPKFAAFIMTNRQYAIFSNPPPFDEPDKIRDCWTLRDIVRKGTALYDLQLRRRENQMWAEMVGVSEYSAKLNEQGISEERWKAATMGQMVPIDFESIRALRDYEPIEAQKETEEYLSEEARLKAESERMRREYDDWLSKMDESMESEEDDDSGGNDEDSSEDTESAGDVVPEIQILKEILADDDDDESQEDGIEPYRSPVSREILGVIRLMGYDPALETIAALAGGV